MLGLNRRTLSNTRGQIARTASMVKGAFAASPVLSTPTAGVEA
jgi:hypothetical protein